MKKIFLDCGFYHGVALQQYIDRGLVDSKWKVFAFEPSPDVKIDERVKDFKLPIKIIKKAVWIDSHPVRFQVSTRDNASSVFNTTGNNGARLVDVPSVDFSDFVAKLPKAEIICNMDIEGSEFYVLQAMLANSTIDRIDILDIEFHHRFMNEFTHEHAQLLIDQILARGVAVRLKIPLQ